MDGLRVRLNAGGANALGSRAAIFAETWVNTATSNAGDYLGGKNDVVGFVNVGGTNTGAGALGAL